MIDTKRIRHATFVTPDLDRQIDYYRSVSGLGGVAREAGRAFMATESEEIAIVLEKADAPACKRLSFEVAPDVEVADLGRVLSDAGIAARLRGGAGPGMPRAL